MQYTGGTRSSASPWLQLMVFRETGWTDIVQALRPALGQLESYGQELMNLWRAGEPRANWESHSQTRSSYSGEFGPLRCRDLLDASRAQMTVVGEPPEP